MPVALVTSSSSSNQAFPSQLQQQQNQQVIPYQQLPIVTTLIETEEIGPILKSIFEVCKKQLNRHQSSIYQSINFINLINLVTSINSINLITSISTSHRINRKDLHLTTKIKMITGGQGERNRFGVGRVREGERSSDIGSMQLSLSRVLGLS